MASLLVQALSIFGAGDCSVGAPGYHTFLGLLPWYQYINLNAQCDFDQTHTFVFLGGNSTVFLILLAVVDDLLRVAGLLAVGFVIYAGAKFITSNGAPDEAAKARTTAINALVGLGITMVAITFVSFLGNQLGGSHTAGSNSAGGIDLSPLPAPANIANGGIVQTVLGIVFGVLGALSFMIMVIAGMRYALSQGDANAAAQAKNTIVYALVGLVLAITAESIVSFVVSR